MTTKTLLILGVLAVGLFIVVKMVGRRPAGRYTALGYGQHNDFSSNPGLGYMGTMPPSA